MKQIKSLIVLATAFALTFGSTAQQQQPRSKGPKKVPTFEDVRYGSSRVILQPGDSTSDRLLDIYLPATERPEGGYPLVMFIHGGGFSGGDKAFYASTAGMVDSLLVNGYAVASINYYLTKKFVPREPREPREPRGEGRRDDRHRAPGDSIAQREPRPRRDVKDVDPVILEQQYHREDSDLYSEVIMHSIDDASTDAVFALRYLDDHAADYGLDMNRVALFGGSAGAMTCLYTAFVQAPEHPQVKAVIDCWGGVRELDRVTNAELPVLIIHGTADSTVPYEQGERLNARLQEIGSNGSRMITMEGRGHAQYRYVGEALMGDIVGFLENNL